MMPAPRPAAVLALVGASMMAAHFGIWPGVAAEKNLDEIEKAVEEGRSKASELERKAETLRRETQSLRVSLIGAAREAQDYEEKLSRIEAELAELETEEASKAADLKARHVQLARTMAALQRIAIQPPEALIAAPASPVDTMRSAMLLRVAVPEIERRAQTVRLELGALDSLRARIARQRQELDGANQQLLLERARISALIQRKDELQNAVSAEQQAATRRVARLAGQAADLRELMERVARESAERDGLIAAALARAEAARKRDEAQARAEAAAKAQAAAQALATAEAEATSQARAAAQTQARSDAAESDAAESDAAKPNPGPADREADAATDRETQSQAQMAQISRPPNIRAFPEEKNSLVLPARGRVVTRYGQRVTAGLNGDGASKGVIIATRPGAQVVATFDGRIVYAGEFRHYGQILIIDHGGRYHTLLAGLDRIDAVVGQWVLAGEPVAIMQSSRGQSPELYLELRRTGQPINPLPWLAKIGDKVRG